MTQTGRATIRELSRSVAISLLESQQVGRLAYSFHDRVDIEPISYVYRDGWLYGRTSPGTKLTTLQHHPWVAFEVDRVEGRFNWQSVVVRGAFYVLDPARSDADREHYAEALRALRTVDPSVLTDADENPHRDIVFRIHVDEITGRQGATA